MITWPTLDISSRCVSCDQCRLICPEDAIIISQGEYFVEQWSCTLCLFCVELCPVECIKMVSN